MHSNHSIFVASCTAALLLAPQISSAAMVTNGDFAACNYGGWQKDTDGFGDFSAGSDFAIQNNGGNCRAAISVDYFDPAGDPFGVPITEAFFANTLFQQLDLTGASDSTFELSMEIDVQSEIDSADPAFLADFLVIGLNDGFGGLFDGTGNPGFLLDPTNVDGAASNVYTFLLDSTFANQPNWFLDIQLNIGWDNTTFLSDGYGSTVYVDNISLTEIPAPSPAASVPEPSSIALFSLGALGIIWGRKKRYLSNMNGE